MGVEQGSGDDAASGAGTQALAQLEWAAATSATVAGRSCVTASPQVAYDAARVCRAAGWMGGTPAPRSRSVDDTSSCRVAPGRSTRVRPVMVAGSAPSRPRSSDPQGKCTVTRSATSSSSAGSASTVATTNSAFGSPPREGLAAARRDAVIIPAALASTPTTSRSGCAAAAAST